jgi:3-oxoacyl-[acyl-carrier-protein] synthase II
MSQKVVVTGLGVVSSIGVGKDRFWENLIRGKSGISKVTLFDTSKLNRHYGGEIKNFKVNNFIPHKIAKFLGRASCFAISAIKLALQDALLFEDNLRNEDIAILIGTTIPEGSTLDFASEMLQKERFNGITKSQLLNIFAPSIPRNIGNFFQIKNTFNILLPTACAAGNYAIGYAFDLIKNGQTEFAIAGGSEAFSRIAFQGFQRLRAMSAKECSPFDKDRKGMLLGEGAAILILESYDSAMERKAHIYCEVLGYGLSCDAHHITIPKTEGIKKAIEKAISNAKISANDIDYICAHGTGTVENDKVEARAINDIFGERRVPVSSIKSMLGHSMGAASAIEAVTCCLAIKEGIVPPTINFKTPDPDCNIDCVPNLARKAKLNIVLNNAFAFGGNNCCVIFCKDSYGS